MTGWGKLGRGNFKLKKLCQRLYVQFFIFHFLYCPVLNTKQIPSATSPAQNFSDRTIYSNILGAQTT